jgi:two-component system, chemotaxis family, chemotaxis protein CheY
MRHILVVDDSVTMRRMVLASLRSLERVRFKEAGSGLEAIEQLALGPVDLMILDLNMPDMHGMEVLRFVRSQSGHRDIPILILTTRGEENSKSEAKASGASDYLTKPFVPDLLARKVRGLLGDG